MAERRHHQRPLQSLPESRPLGVHSHPEPIKVVVCGAHDAGKTALITRYCDHHFVSGYIPYEEEWCCRRVFGGRAFLLEFVEVPGDMPAALGASLERVDACLLVYDVGERGSFEEMEDVYEKVIAASGGEGGHVPVGVVAAKADTPGGKWRVEADEGRRFAGRVGGVFAACSARGGEGVEDAVELPVMVAVEGKVELLREREERHWERMEMYWERGRKGEGTATVMETVRRWRPFGKW